MNSFRNKSLTNERRRIDENAATPSAVIVEKDQGVLNKLTSGRPYNAEDMEKCARPLLRDFGYQPSQLAIVDEREKLATVLRQVTLTSSPFFVIHKLKKNHWVVFCLVLNRSQKVVLYKDSTGADPPSTLKERIKEGVPGATIVAHPKREQEDDYSHGPMCLRNLRVLLDHKDVDALVRGFKSINFCTQEGVNNDRLSVLVKDIKLLAHNEKFKQSLREFITNLPLDLGEDVKKYRGVLAEELAKGEDGIDHSKVQTARDQYLNPDKIKNLEESYKLSDNAKDVSLDIEARFPAEMRSVQNVFQLLENVRADEQLRATLRSVSQLLGLDYDRLRKFYDARVLKQVEKKMTKLKPKDVKLVAAELPEMKLYPPQKNLSPLEQLLAETTLGMDKEPTYVAQNLTLDQYRSKYQADPELVRLEQLYHKVKKAYDDRWKDKTPVQVNAWAVGLRGHLKDTCDAIAALDRGFNLTTGGFRLRDSQVLSILIFLDDRLARGRLCQVQTGEGKTVIVSVLAVFKVLQGQTVDVITSNPVLAQEGADETKTFYELFGVTVATNNTAGNGYTADVLYGTISNFQFDYLKDTFEGMDVRADRKFGVVILDEVDSMLIDNGGHIAKLAKPYPGMESFRYIYIKIWQQLHEAEKSYVEDRQAELKVKLDGWKNRREQGLVTEEEAQREYEDWLNQSAATHRKIIKDKIRQTNPGDVDLIPGHLRDYVKDKLDVWIKNAVYAKYDCQEHQQYRVANNDKGDKVVVPIDYRNTGVMMKNTIWSYGLHQFIQLKHNLRLTFESLTSSFVSNIGYIRKYDDSNILGMTGTLGSRAEQQLLAHIYNVDFAKLPTYKPKVFQELTPIVAEDESWSSAMTVAILEQVDKGRATLVIFETENDLNTVKTDLDVLKKLGARFTLRIYANEDDKEETRAKVKPGDVILATNIAGRGTNFKTEKTLESKGGLHVFVGFLPYNLRVEGQAFGRTSRQGNVGTAQLLVRRSEVTRLAISKPDPDFSDIKRARDALERVRLQDIDRVLVKELNFKDELFGYFSDHHRTLKEDNASREFAFVLDDLEEYWAFWLEKKNYKGAHLEGLTPKTEFAQFLAATRDIVAGRIIHNPYYCLSLADCHVENRNPEKAMEVLQNALKLGRGHADLIYGAYLRMFDLAIEGGNQLMERFKKAVAKVFFITYTKDATYRTKALSHLRDAKKGLAKEIDYIQKLLDGDLKTILVQTGEGEENLFLKHLYSRLTCLGVYQGNVDKLLELMASIEGGIAIKAKSSDYLDVQYKKSQEVGEKLSMTPIEIVEMQSIGLSVMYDLKEVFDASDAVIIGAQIQIGGGIAALAAGFAFPPIFFIMSSIAATLISEGVIDIVMELISKGDSEFSQKDYMKGKFITYGIAIVTLGISAIVSCTTIMAKAIEYCRKLSSALRRSTYLKTLCTRLADKVDKIGNFLEKALTQAKFSSLSKTQQLDELSKLKEAGDLTKLNYLGGVAKLGELQELQRLGKLVDLTRTQMLFGAVKSITVATADKVAKILVYKYVVRTIMDELLGDLDKQIEKGIKEMVVAEMRRHQVLLDKLKTGDPKAIDAASSQYLKQNLVVSVVQGITVGVLKKCNNWIVDLLVLGASAIYKAAELKDYAGKWCRHLEDTLEMGANKNDVEGLIEKLSDKVTARIHTLFVGILNDSLSASKRVLGRLKEKLESSKKDEVASDGGAVVVTNQPRENPMAQHYAVLGLSPGASAAEVTKQYRKLALQVHPDKNPDDPLAHENMAKLNEAYEALKGEN